VVVNTFAKISQHIPILVDVRQNTGTLHEDLRAFLCTEVTGWRILAWGSPSQSYTKWKGHVLANVPELLYLTFIS
jgi:hypothetical protein